MAPSPVGQVLLTYKDTDAWEGGDLLAGKEVIQGRRERRQGKEGRKRARRKAIAVQPQTLTCVGKSLVIVPAPPAPARLTSCRYYANGSFPSRSAGGPNLPYPGSGTPGSPSPWGGGTVRFGPKSKAGEGGKGRVGNPGRDPGIFNLPEPPPCTPQG